MWLLIVTFCVVYDDTCHYELYQDYTTEALCLKQLESTEGSKYLWECVEQDWE